MRLLHTADWHIGKRLGRFDRLDEHAAAIDEVVAIAERKQADAVIHSGDLFDRPQPPVEAMSLAFDGLRRLAADGARPVVVVAGNHDSAELFEVLRPFLRPQGIHLVGAIRRPDDGGVVALDTAAGALRVAALPFLRQGRVVDFMADTGTWYGNYADRVRRLAEVYAEALTAGPEAVTVLAAHFLVTGARLGTSGRRGERSLHMGEAYAATAEAIPPTVSYVAMGHIHAPQPVPGANVPAEYAGSLLPLDFGEAGEEKRVVLVDVEPGRPAQVASQPIAAGRPLIQAEGTWDELAGRDDLDGAYLDLTVHCDGPDPELAARAAARYPYLVWVRARYPAQRDERPSRVGRSLVELYGDYSLAEYGEPPDEAVVVAFAELAEEVASAAS